MHIKGLKKTVLLVSIVAIFSTVFAGCSGTKTEGNPANGSAKTKLTFFYSIGDPLFKQIVEERTASFMQKNPDITIENISINSGSYLDGLKTKDAVGQFPDLLEGRDVPTWVAAGKLAVMPDELMSIIKDPPEYKGKYYAVPFSAANTLGFFYNAKLFKDNGLTEPKNYKEFIDLCEKIKAKGVAPIVVGAKDIFHVGFLWSAYWINEVTGSNPNWIKDRYEGKVKWTDPLIVNAFTKYADLFKKGYVEPGFMSTGDNQIASILVSGKAAMFYSGTHMFKQIVDADPNFQFGWFPLPDENGKINLLGGSQLGGWTYSAECAKDDAKAKAAQRFIKFWFEKDNYIDYLQKMSAFPTVKEKLDFKYSIPQMSKVLDAMATANRIELGWNQKWGDNEIPPAFRNFAYKVAQEWATGTSSIEAGLKKMDEEWEVEAKAFLASRK